MLCASVPFEDINLHKKKLCTYDLRMPFAVVKENAHLMLNLIILERLNLTIIKKTDQHSSMLDMLKFQLKLIRTGSYRKVNHKWTAQIDRSVGKYLSLPI